MIGTQTQPKELGQIEVAPEVLGVIAGIAASDVDGVVEMHGTFYNALAEKFGRVNYTKGVKIDMINDAIVVDVYITVAYGKALPLVAEKVQENVQSTIFTMTNLDIREVNVHVIDVQIAKHDIGH
ncbi:MULTISPECIES: Asp23/Gls24 family envelope stress response protein [Brochothrix]|uniref:Asp23/Gls24 family envelope stress response protein n=1 Tax=Brochothrix thermosphacta TaxID=2756 RepID=A0A1D2KQA6_BROTH|nr:MULTISPECIES: Asp23/Gls24 family envelope stress response protein [Brochothrix]ANZ95892.1 hypothetical protein BFC19_11100 [Brochothrix thermosphacta]ANZ97974.1 hypothetical protein BFC20_09825 [Brochothrix thermosphacta]ATF25194.1 Asp23/Gls24 family envelope stress response protein [Brochothrix thermosphacta]ATH84577.1 Asp23/Gls24 family envelope stress response protein [Brochothrix thermosphacta]EUJ38532.1 hypothetical protein BTHER_01415 [Brochothrix thermosphacta DSM 20171 = FSL F6-1036